MKPYSGFIPNLYLHVSDGKSQTERLLPALDPDYFHIYDLRFHEWLAMAVDYAEMMEFYDADNQANGTWKSFFSVDEAVIIAIILSTDTNKLISRFEQDHYLSGDGHAAAKAWPDQNRQQIMTLCSVVSMLDNWFVLLSSAQSRAGKELYQLLEGILTSSKKELNELLRHSEWLLPGRSLNEIVSPSLIELAGLTFSNGQIKTSTPAVEKINPKKLTSIYHSLINAIEIVQAGAADLLPVSLTSRRHDPAAGLLIAFLQLFQRLQHKINRFTPHYIDFYYGQVLGAEAHSFELDHVYLVLSLSKKNYSVVIPAGTVFLAGQNSNKQEILYTSDIDVLVHSAKIRAIHTLYFNRDATGCQISTIPVFTDEDAPDLDELQSYPLLGAPKSAETETDHVKHARLGFALASNTLLLKEGKRTVCITMKFETNQGEAYTLEQSIKKIADTLSISPAGESATDISELDIFFKVFRSIFVISLTTADGWERVAEYVPSYSGLDKQLEQNSLRIIFTLPAETPPVEPYCQAIHGEDYQTQLPIAKFELNPQGYLYPYDILSQFALAWIKIDVAVTGYRSLLLYNNIGQLSSLTPFAPFGPVPEVGSYFIVGCEEASMKQLNSFDIEIKWGGLPTVTGGFKSYYQGYDEPVDYTAYKVSLAVLTNGNWFPENTRTLITDTLFQAENIHQAESLVNETKKLTCDRLIPHWSALDYQHAISGLNYSPSSKKGFFKFTLIAPKEAFGHKSYPQALTSVLTYNAQQKIFKRPKPVPNPPYTPMITSLWVNYKASAKMLVKNETGSDNPKTLNRLIHLHPLGWEDTVMQSDQSVYLLPQYSYAGNLLIGLDELNEGGLVTLYFHLCENSLPMERNPMEELNWFYLSDNQWIPLHKKQIISDSSYGFMTSGVVTLDIPADISQQNTVLPGGLFWLRVSANHDMEKFCSVYSIYAQALRASRKSDETIDNINNLQQPLPAGTIKRMKQSIPGVDRAWQVQQSFGGKVAEERKDVRTRMSGRLKHKNRALIPADYELLILENFPQLYKVKCFANLIPDWNPEKSIRPGHITIVALPYETLNEQTNEKPWLSGHLIGEIKDFISRHAPSFVKIYVINPVYETIQVRCTIKLKDTHCSGLHINRLNQAISDFISPWNDSIGYKAHFGWRISVPDIEAYIQQFDFIERVTNLSILRITSDDKNLYTVFDSAAQAESVSEFRVITPKYPWSVSAPIQQHFIEVDDSLDTIDPKITGVGELEIGSTFIISEGGNDKKE